jgi:tetratricopeptide (TPR) repeat protein
MKRRLSQINPAIALTFLTVLLTVALCSQTLAQRPGSQAPKPQPAKPQPAKPQPANQGPGRELMVKEIRSGGALDGRGKLWALVIGVSSYKNLAPKEQLEFAHRDAEAFASFLRTPSGGGFPSSQLTLLTNQNATLSSIRSALGTTLPRSVEPEDMVVIFFAGHGVVEGERDGYLLAHDSDPQNLYATALQLSELNRIITERLKARSVILIADACHSGQLGWTSRGTAAETVMVNRYLDEVGKSGKGVFRLLASRADQRSYEDKRWGGGHGCFTWFLLEGLKGRADRDGDGFVRAGELLDFLSENVPKATQALQHPRAAGDIDPRLPMAVLPSAAPVNVATIAPQLVSLEVRGAPGLEVYLDNTFRGRVLQSGVLVIEQLKPGVHDLSTVAPNAEPIAQKVSLSAAKSIFTARSASVASSSPLVAQIKQSLNSNDIRGAFTLYQQLVQQSPKDPQRASIEASLGGIFEAIGQNAINVYVQSAGMEVKPGMFRNAAEAFRLLKIVNANADQRVDAKYLFCDGRAKIEEQRFQEAVDQLNRAIAIDPRAAHAHSSLGLAFREMKKEDRAFDAFKRAAELAPAWVLPQIQIGLSQMMQGRLDKAESAFKEAARLDPRHVLPHLRLAEIYLMSGKFDDAEREGNAALTLAPNLGAASLILGQVYENSKRWQQAASAYEKGIAQTTGLTPAQREDYSKRAEKCRKKAK